MANKRNFTTTESMVKRFLEQHDLAHGTSAKAAAWVLALQDYQILPDLSSPINRTDIVRGIAAIEGMNLSPVKIRNLASRVRNIANGIEKA